MSIDERSIDKLTACPDEGKACGGQDVRRAGHGVQDNPYQGWHMHKGRMYIDYID